MALSISSSREKVNKIVCSVKEYSVLVGDAKTRERVEGLACAPGLNMASEAESLRSLSKDLESGLFKLLVMGKFKNGKSTFVNALLGRMMMAAKTTATTAVIAMVEYGTDEKRVQVYENGSDHPRTISLEQFTEEFALTKEDQAIIEEGGDVDRFAHVDYVVMQSSAQMFEDGVRLIDSPGLEEAHARTKTTTEFVPKANAIIFTLTATALFSAAERKYISENFAGKGLRNVFFVINRIDNLASPDALENVVKPAVREQLKGVFADENGRFDEELFNKRVFYTNAYGALCVRTGQPYTVFVGRKAFPISFVGRFKTGKSSLINVLIGMDILPTKATTATSVITRIVYGPTMCAYVREHGNLRPVSIQEAQDVILNHRVTDVYNTPEVIFELPVDWLKGNIELHDTPGMDDSAQNGLLEKIAQNALKDTDLCVFVYDACQFISARESEITQKVQTQLGGNVVFAVNRINLLNSIDGLNQVENMAKTVFSGMGNELVGNDRHYLMCSAPGMADLDGFDIWLKDIMDSSNADKLNDLRRRTASAKIGEMYEEVRGNLAAIEDEAKCLLDGMEKEHKRRIGNVQDGINSTMRSQKIRIKEDRMKVDEFLCDTSGLSEYLIKKKRSGNSRNYNAVSKAAVREYYTKRAEEAFSSYCPYMERYGYDFIAEAVDGFNFPGTHSYSKSASGSEVGSGAVIGGILGTIFGFGLGTPLVQPSVQLSEDRIRTWTIRHPIQLYLCRIMCSTPSKSSSAACSAESLSVSIPKPMLPALHANRDWKNL